MYRNLFASISRVWEVQDQGTSIWGGHFVVTIVEGERVLGVWNLLFYNEHTHTMMPIHLWWQSPYILISLIRSHIPTLLHWELIFQHILVDSHMIAQACSSQQ
jgi:hypothetical protein